jgi:hypothetical protein
MPMLKTRSPEPRRSLSQVTVDICKSGESACYAFENEVIQEQDDTKSVHRVESEIEQYSRAIKVIADSFSTCRCVF